MSSSDMHSGLIFGSPPYAELANSLLGTLTNVRHISTFAGDCRCVEFKRDVVTRGLSGSGRSGGGCGGLRGSGYVRDRLLLLLGLVSGSAVEFDDSFCP